MHRIAVVLLCLAGGIAAAAAQSLSPPSVATPVVLKASPPPVIAPTLQRQAAKPAVADIAEPAVKPVEQSAAKPAEQPAPPQKTKPVEQTVAEPAAASPAAKSAALPSLETSAPKIPETKTVARAAEPSCPGHPDALGTSRVLAITPGEFQQLGTINYKQSLPLQDHEVVLTFDDGPIPPYTNSVLDTLAANCVKATYFLVGEMARLRPYLVRRIYNEGHSIGTHSQDHPYAFQRLSMAKVAFEVNAGIASVDAAIGDPKAVSPFFRIPGFGRTKAIDRFLEQKGLVTWSADIDTDDWKRGTTPSALIQRTMRRLNARGRGIILMHDIHPDTALALPTLLKTLKTAGYHVVHVVLAGAQPKSVPELVPTAIEQESWPRVLHAHTAKAGPAARALRHRVRLALAVRHHRHARVQKRATVLDYTDIALERRLGGN